MELNFIKLLMVGFVTGKMITVIFIFLLQFMIILALQLFIHLLPAHQGIPFPITVSVLQIHHARMVDDLMVA